MKKLIITVLTLALVLTLTACQDTNVTPTMQQSPSPSQTVTDAPTEAPTEAPTVAFGGATLPPRFQDLASLELVRDVIYANENKIIFAYRYSEDYTFPQITGFVASEVQLMGENKTFTVSLDDSDLTVDSVKYVALLTVEGSFEEWEIYPFIIKLTVTFDGGDESPITDFFSYEHELIG